MCSGHFLRISLGNNSHYSKHITMTDSMKLYWELVFTKQPNNVLLRQLNNPLREFEAEMIDGAILDIGCGQSTFLLDYLSTDRHLIAIDNEQIQLDFLKKRVESETSSTIENWSFLNQNFPQDDLPDLPYSAIIFSNLLHFFTLRECVDIGKIVAKKSTEGTLIYAGVHSIRFYANNPKNPKNNEYFKHYFTIRDLDKIFPNHSFERIYYADVEKIDSQSHKELVKEWIVTDLESEGITDLEQIDLIKKEYLKNKKQSDIIAMYRKK
jgi:SAM-dependent methyltransferase